jgi:hypothetical protein
VTKRIDQMRANPGADWKIADIEAVCREFGVRCVPPSGGSHYKVSHPASRDILTIPSRRPIKPVCIRKLVRFIDLIAGHKTDG